MICKAFFNHQFIITLFSYLCLNIYSLIYPDKTSLTSTSSTPNRNSSSKETFTSTPSSKSPSKSTTRPAPAVAANFRSIRPTSAGTWMSPKSRSPFKRKFNSNPLKNNSTSTSSWPKTKTRTFTKSWKKNSKKRKNRRKILLSK